MATISCLRPCSILLHHGFPRGGDAKRPRSRRTADTPWTDVEVISLGGEGHRVGSCRSGGTARAGARGGASTAGEVRGDRRPRSLGVDRGHVVDRRLVPGESRPGPVRDQLTPVAGRTWWE